jgi:hypothetical protein
VRNDAPVQNGVCLWCGSGVLGSGEHLRDDLEPCRTIFALVAELDTFRFQAYNQQEAAIKQAKRAETAEAALSRYRDENLELENRIDERDRLKAALLEAADVIDEWGHDVSLYRMTCEPDCAACAWQSRNLSVLVTARVTGAALADSEGWDEWNADEFYPEDGQVPPWQAIPDSEGGET